MYQNCQPITVIYSLSINVLYRIITVLVADVNLEVLWITATVSHVIQSSYNIMHTISYLQAMHILSSRAMT